MSLRLRFKYQVRSLRDVFYNFQIPSFLIGREARIVIVALLVLSGGAYVTQVNALTTSGYQVRQLEQHVADLDSETKQLQTELATAGSLTSINRRLPDLQMVKVASVVHIKVPVSAMVAER